MYVHKAVVSPQTYLCQFASSERQMSSLPPQSSDALLDTSYVCVQNGLSLSLYNVLYSVIILPV